MEGCRVRDGVLLPRPSPGFEGEGGDVIELRQIQKGGSPDRWVGE